MAPQLALPSWLCLPVRIPPATDGTRVPPSLPPSSPYLVLQRLFQMYNRLPDYQLVRMAVTLLVGFVFGSLAWNQGGDS